MKKRFWKGLRAIDLIAALTITFFVVLIVATRYDNFKCRAIHSEAKYSLQELTIAQSFYHSEFDRYATAEQLIIKDEIVVLPDNYYTISDGAAPTSDSFLIIASGKEGTQAFGESWSVDEQGVIKPIHTNCKKNE